ncbi:hypothetical protein E4U41_001049 [Claviceps citrina]|nr:hypothetical protein E4U41_001049 [Claviceps citrina]
MSSAQAVYKGSAPAKPNHRFTNHGLAANEQSRSAGCVEDVHDSNLYTPLSAPQARRDRIAQELAAADAAFRGTQG